MMIATRDTRLSSSYHAAPHAIKTWKGKDDLALRSRQASVTALGCPRFSCKISTGRQELVVVALHGPLSLVMDWSTESLPPELLTLRRRRLQIS